MENTTIRINKKFLYFTLAIVVIIAIGYFAVNGGQSSKSGSTDTPGSLSSNFVPENDVQIPAGPADKIEVVNFFGTQRCASCIVVGKLTKKTIEEKFPEEVKSGKLVFKEINGELPENREIVDKYQARGSSLFVNAIRGDKEDIYEDTTVWRLVNNESLFISYFENKLNTLLGK